MNKQGNTYTILYASVMVIIVAALLAIVSVSLKPMQQANIEIDKKKQILSSVNLEPTTQNAVELYGKHIIDSYVVDANAAKVEGADAFTVDVAAEVKKAKEERQLPVFVAQLDNGDIKYILPLYGAGLWGPIWGYIALESDMNTVKGIVMDHSGETPGLGAEITTANVQNSFVGKTIFEGTDFVSVSMRKGGATNNHEVDAISGGTKTCDGVNAMLKTGLEGYLPFINANKSNK